MSNVANIIDREMRVVNRHFSLAEYGSAWSKMERYLFIELYNVIKNFYLSRDDSCVQSLTDESITIKFPINLLDTQLFSLKNRAAQLASACDGLMQKTIGIIEVNDDGQTGFDFINMFTRITYNPDQDKKNLIVRIPREIYNEMIPIESYCQLDKKLLGEFNSGNTIRLYEVFKSYAFKTKFSITFTELRKNLGFYRDGSWSEWKHFNAKVLKPAVKEINKHKEFDIEVSYSKERGSESITFLIIQHHKQAPIGKALLRLDDTIVPSSRQLNMIQNKYIDTLIDNLIKADVKVSNPVELKSWIVSDLVSQQQKQGDDFDWKRSCNWIAKQLKTGKYTRPYSHTHLAQ